MTFKTLNSAMTTTHVLMMPNFDKVFELHTDASNVEVSSVLTRERRSLAFIIKVFRVQKKGRMCIHKRCLLSWRLRGYICLIY